MSKLPCDRVKRASPNVLALNYASETDYLGMMPELAGRLIVLSHEPMQNTAGLMYYEHVAELETSAVGWERAVDLYAEFGYGTVITDNEYEIERCGRLRDHFGLEGQSHGSAVLFRDKLRMKGAAGAAVRVPRSARVVSKEDVQRFVDDVGFPVVVKPINQGGSRDVSVVKESHDLELLDSASWVFDMEVEQYISGDVYHVDAFVDEDLWFASTARYSAPPLEFLHGSPLAHVLIEPDSDIARRLTEFLSSLLAVMSSPASSAYHLEVIEDSRGELWLCEIASRVGGAQIPELVERTYGFSLPAQSMRSACGLSKTQYPRFGGRLFTSVIMPSPGAKLAAFPSSLPFEWVDEVRLRRPVGDWFPRSKHSNDYAACVILHAPSFEVGLSRAGAISAFLREQVMWAER